MIIMMMMTMPLCSKHGLIHDHNKETSTDKENKHHNKMTCCALCSVMLLDFTLLRCITW